MRSQDKFSRRLFLKASGIGAGLLPLLGDELAQGQCLLAGRKRLITLAWGNGYLNWVTGIGTTFTMPGFMAALEPHRADLLIPNALWNKAWYDGYPKDYSNLAHESPIGMLTARRSKGRLAPSGPSLDYFVGNHFKSTAKLPWSVVNLGVMRKSPYWTASGPDAIATPDDDPYSAFDRIFGGAKTGTAAQIDKARLLRKSVLDYLKKDLERFSSKLGQEDKVRIDSHLSSIRDIEGRLAATAVPTDCLVPTLGPKFDVQSSVNYERVLRAQIDLGVAALAAGLTQVLTIQVSNGVGAHVILSWLGYERTGIDPGSGGTDLHAHHGVAHEGGEIKERVDRWFFEQAAYLIEKLKAIKEGGTSIFDQSVVLIPNNMDHGNRHRIMGLPWLIAGGAGGALKTGRVVKSQNDYSSRLLVSVCHALGVPSAGFADPEYGGELAALGD